MFQGDSFDWREIFSFPFTSSSGTSLPLVTALLGSGWELDILELFSYWFPAAIISSINEIDVIGDFSPTTFLYLASVYGPNRPFNILEDFLPSFIIIEHSSSVKFHALTRLLQVGLINKLESSLVDFFRFADVRGFFFELVLIVDCFSNAIALVVSEMAASSSLTFSNGETGLVLHW